MPNASENILALDDFGKVAVWVIEHSPITLFALFIASAAVIFLPSAFIVYIGLSRILPANSSIPGATLLISGSILLAYGVHWIISVIGVKMTLNRNKKSLLELTAAEITILSRYLQQGSKSQYLDADGLARGLELSGIIFRASETGVRTSSGVPRYSYNIHDWAWREIRKNPSVLRPRPSESPSN